MASTTTSQGTVSLEDARRVTAAGEDRVEDVLLLVAAVLRDEDRDVLADRLCGGVPVEPLGALVPECDHALAVLAQDPVRRRIDDRLGVGDRNGFAHGPAPFGGEPSSAASAPSRSGFAPISSLSPLISRTRSTAEPGATTSWTASSRSARAIRALTLSGRIPYYTTAAGARAAALAMQNRLEGDLRVRSLQG